MVTSMSVENALAQKLGITAVRVRPTEAVFTMPVAGNTQTVGALHGGATAALCENCASAAANAHAEDLGRVAVGTELTISHLRPAFTGGVKAVAHAVHLGRRRTVHSVEVWGEDENLVATALATNTLVEAE